ncbi:MAG: hypothetical protein V1722_04660 [Candidatus Micrarchaeota archaeon]
MPVLLFLEMFNPSSHSVSLGSASLFLDVKGKAGVTFVSHGHADHAVKSASQLLCSKETMALLKVRKYAKAETQRIDVIADEAKVSLHNAGHVLGSRQVLVENGARFLYTGDLGVSESLTAGAVAVPQCDELLVDCTFGAPRYVFPSRVEVGGEVAKWTLANERKGIISIIGGYSLGKAQEIIAHLNEAGITPVVPKVIAEVSQVYNEHGCKLQFVSTETQEGQSCLTGGFTAVFPLNLVKHNLGYAVREGYCREVRLAHCSGWTLDYRRPGIAGFPLSDHCDFEDLLNFVERTGAKKVHCTASHASEFALALQRKGIDARVKGEKQPQQLLNAFQ